MSKSHFFSLNNRFWQIDRNQPFTAHETRLFFYLLNEANQRGWPDEFIHPDNRACANAGLSPNGMKAARKRLIEQGLLNVETGGHGKGDGARYKFRYHDVTPIAIPNTTPIATPESTLVSDKVSRKVSPDDTKSSVIETKTFSNTTYDERDEEILALDESKKKEGNPPPTPALSFDNPIPVGITFGDGELQKQVVGYYGQYPGLYATDIIIPFLQHHTKPENGVEGWRTMRQWDIDIRLRSWTERKAIRERELVKQAQLQPCETNGHDATTGQGEIIRTQYTKQSFGRVTR